MITPFAAGGGTDVLARRLVLVRPLPAENLTLLSQAAVLADAEATVREHGAIYAATELGSRPAARLPCSAHADAVRRLGSRPGAQERAGRAPEHEAALTPLRITPRKAHSPP